MTKLSAGFLAAFALALGLFSAEIIAQSCTLTPNLGLCKGARGSAEWDVFLNSNFDLLDSLALNTGVGAQTKSGTLTLSNSLPLKLTSATFQPGDVLFLDSTKTLTRSSLLSWSPISGTLIIGAIQLPSSGDAIFNSVRLLTGASAGKVLTSDGSGNATWQSVSGASSGWSPGAGNVTLSVIGDEVGIGVVGPTEKLEVMGGIKIGAAQTTQAGVIQWDGSNFRGYTGGSWVNLDYTAASAGGWTDSGTGVALTTSTDYVGIGGAGSASTKLMITGATNDTPLGMAQTVTSGSPSAISLSSSWNVGASTPTLLSFTLTDVASGAASKLMEFVVGGNSKFSLRKDGQLTLGAGIVATTGTFSGALEATTIKLSTGAAAGYVLTSDASGNGTWAASGAGAGIPSGMIAIFDAACPSGWTSVSGSGGAFETKFLYGGATYGATGGGATHAHTVNPAAFNTDSTGSHGHTVPMGTFTSDMNSTYETVSGTPADKNIADNDHNHSITIADRTITSSGAHAHSIDVPSTTSSDVSNLPPYITVVYCKKN